MLTKFLARLEDAKHPLLGPNIWTLNTLGLFRPKKKWHKMIFAITQISLALFFATALIDIWVNRADVFKILINLKYTFLTLVNGAKVLTFIVCQSKWKAIYKYVTEADIEERTRGDSEQKSIVQEYTSYCRSITSFYWILSCMTIVTVVNTTPITYAFTPDYGVKMRDGALPFPHILHNWLPFDEDSSPGCWLVLAWHLQLTVYGGLLMATYDANIVVLMTFFENHLRLLQYQSSVIFNTDTGATITDEEFYGRIKDCHRKHSDLIKHAQLFNSVLSPVMFLYMVVCSMFISGIAILLTMEITTVEKVINAEYLLFAVSQLFVYCFHSNKVFYMSKQVSYGPYASKWYGADARKMQMILILAGQLKKTFIFTAGPFIHLTMSTFIAILKGAYSYYTLLRD